MGLGDATQLLAFYITTLATEHKLLSDGNRAKDVPMTRTELYYAYKAFERLDYFAEDEFPFVTIEQDATSPDDLTAVSVKYIRRNQNDYPASLNGYFNREDYPKEFFGDDFSDPCSNGAVIVPSNEHYQHFNSSITRQSQDPVYNIGQCTDIHYYRYEQSPLGDPCPLDWPIEWSADERTGKENIFETTLYPNIPGGYVDMDKQYENSPSTDQIGSLMQAFLMTKVSMPNYNVPVTKLDGSIIQVNFVQLAKDNSARILGHLKSFPFPWKVVLPNNEKVPQDKGGNAKQYSFVLAQIGNMIHDNNLALPYYGIPTGFHDFISLNRRIEWPIFRSLPPAPNGKNRWNSHSDIMNYATTSASWTNLNAPVSFYHTTRKSNTLNIVKETSSRYGWDSFHMMVMGYLHNEDMNNEDISSYTNNNSFNDFEIHTSSSDSYISYVKKSLSTAPCEGPYNYAQFSNGDSQVSGDIGPKGWNTSKRWFNPKHVATNKYKTKDGANVLRDRTPLPAATGYYSGLDFMMLHNFYYLNSNQFLPKYVNYIDRHYDENLPNALANYGPLTIAGYESLTADNTIGSQMEVTYQASTEIHLTTDFHATAGVDFHAVIQDITCSLDFKSATVDTTQSSYGMSAFGERKVYADISDKFEHLYVLPDSITTEFLDLQIEKMNKTNLYNEDAFAYDFSSCNLELKSNAVTGQLNFDVESAIEGITSYKIFDLNGKLVLEGDLSPYQNSVSISQLPVGMFLIQVVSSS